MRSLALLIGLLALGCSPSADPADAPDSTGASEAGDAARPPNIVLLIADDQGHDDFGFMGSTWVETPNLDRLAKDGLVFELAHNSGSFCKPSLNTLLTGLHTFQWDRRMARLRASVEGFEESHAIEHFATLPRALGERGYVSFQAGKYWEGDFRAGGFTGGMTEVFDPEHPHGGDAIRIGRETMEPVERFVEENADRPFLLWFAPLIPHVPHNAAQRYRDPYEGRGFSKAAVGYYASCSWFDDLAGQVLLLLEEKGLTENTLVVLLSDNGWDQAPFTTHGDAQEAMMGGMRGKHSSHDRGFRTPIVLRWPGTIAPGRLPKALVSTTDLMPTILGYAGVDAPTELPGIDLRPVIAGDAALEREFIIGSAERVRRQERSNLQTARELVTRRDEILPFVDYFHLRSRDWHYQRFEMTGRQALYDLRSDPEEERDVASEHPERVARYAEEIEQWRRRMEASVAVGTAR